MIKTRFLHKTLHATQNKTRSFSSWSNIFSSERLNSSTSTKNVKNINQQSLIEEVATQHDLSISKSKRIVQTVFDTIVENLAQNNDVKIYGFGRFSNTHVKEQMRYIPGKGVMKLPARQKVRFSAFKAFKDSINEV